MGGINWREVSPILAIGGDATVIDGYVGGGGPNRASAWAVASALTTGRMRAMPVATLE
jgi:hypothetical protein